jgi:hypothetical protein
MTWNDNRMLINFKIKEELELCTTFEYKEILKNVQDFFIEESSKQGLAIQKVKAYFNPAENEGCIDYEYRNPEDLADLPDMDFAIANGYLTIVFYDDYARKTDLIALN